jgi:hypothetical protein
MSACTRHPHFPANLFKSKLCNHNHCTWHPFAGDSFLNQKVPADSEIYKLLPELDGQFIRDPGDRV